MFSNVENANANDGTFTIIDNRKTIYGVANAGASGSPQPNTLSMQYMPSKPDIFYGRDDLIQEIAERLCDKTSSRRVCILGPGGMGKTSLALAAVESPAIQSTYASRCYWIPCIEASSSSLLLQVLSIHLRIMRPTASNDILNDILSELNRSKEPTLLLLDNFETPWFPAQGTTKAVADILFRLNELNHVAILVTMRGSGAPCNRIQWHTMHLRPVSKEAARLIFYDTYPSYPRSGQDLDLDALLESVGHMPYAVMLMAKSGETCEYSAKDLLEEWKRAGTDMISHSGSPEDDMNRSISLSVNRDFVQRNSDAKLLLQMLSLLPAGTSKVNLSRWWAPNIKSIASAIVTLSNAALLSTKNEQDASTSTILFVLPVVQSFMHSTDQIPEDVRRKVHEGCCQYIFDHVDMVDRLTYQCDTGSLVAEDTNIRSILLASKIGSTLIPPQTIIEALLCFASYCTYNRPSIEVAEHAVTLARSFGDQKLVAEALYGLGNTCVYLGQYDVSERCFSESYCIFKQSYAYLPWCTAQSGLELAQSRLFLDQPRRSIIEFLQNLQVTLGDALGDLHKGCILRLLGRCLHYDDCIPEALDTFREATEIFIRMDEMGEAAHSLRFMSVAYRSSLQFQLALKSSVEACAAAKRLQLNVGSHSLIEMEYGYCLVSLNQDLEALPVFQKCLSIFESMGRLLDAAHCSEEIGDIYVRQANYCDASTAFQGAILKYFKLGWKDGMEYCRRQLERIKSKEGSGCGD